MVHAGVDQIVGEKPFVGVVYIRIQYEMMKGIAGSVLLLICLALVMIVHS